MRVRDQESHERAIELLALAGELGNADSEYRLGKLYEDGNSLRGRDEEKAKEHYRKAVAIGHPEAEYSLGALLF